MNHLSTVTTHVTCSRGPGLLSHTDLGTWDGVVVETEELGGDGCGGGRRRPTGGRGGSCQGMDRRCVCMYHRLEDTKGVYNGLKEAVITRLGLPALQQNGGQEHLFRV